MSKQNDNSGTDGGEGLEKTMPAEADDPCSKYKYLLEIGKGSYGVVNKAKRIDNEELVAIKTVQCKTMPNLEQALEEFRSHAGLPKHENIVHFHECIADWRNRRTVIDSADRNADIWKSIMQSDFKEIELSFVMEYCDGGDMNDYILSRAPDATLNSSFCIQLAKGVEFLHANLVMHRDLKPENILIKLNPCKENQPVLPTIKIGDFGLAKVCNGKKSATDNCEFDSACGSDFFMAPEVFMEKYTIKADVFALGIIFWAMVDRITFKDSSSGKILLGTYVQKDGKVTPMGEALNHDEMINLEQLLVATSVPKKIIYKEAAAGGDDKVDGASKATHDGSTCIDGDSSQLRRLICRMISPHEEVRPSSKQLIQLLNDCLNLNSQTKGVGTSAADSSAPSTSSPQQQHNNNNNQPPVYSRSLRSVKAPPLDSPKPVEGGGKKKRARGGGRKRSTEAAEPVTPRQNSATEPPSSVSRLRSNKQRQTYATPKELKLYCAATPPTVDLNQGSAGIFSSFTPNYLLKQQERFTFAATTTQPTNTATTRRKLQLTDQPVAESAASARGVACGRRRARTTSCTSVMLTRSSSTDDNATTAAVPPPSTTIRLRTRRKRKMEDDEEDEKECEGVEEKRSKLRASKRLRLNSDTPSSASQPPDKSKQEPPTPPAPTTTPKEEKAEKEEVKELQVDELTTPRVQPQAATTSTSATTELTTVTTTTTTSSSSTLWQPHLSVTTSSSIWRPHQSTPTSSAAAGGSGACGSSASVMRRLMTSSTSQEAFLPPTSHLRMTPVSQSRPLVTSPRPHPQQQQQIVTRNKQHELRQQIPAAPTQESRPVQQQVVTRQHEQLEEDPEEPRRHPLYQQQIEQEQQKKAEEAERQKRAMTRHLMIQQQLQQEIEHHQQQQRVTRQREQNLIEQQKRQQEQMEAALKMRQEHLLQQLRQQQSTQMVTRQQHQQFDAHHYLRSFAVASHEQTPTTSQPRTVTQTTRSNKHHSQVMTRQQQHEQLHEQLHRRRQQQQQRSYAATTAAAARMNSCGGSHDQQQQRLRLLHETTRRRKQDELLLRQQQQTSGGSEQQIAEALRQFKPGYLEWAASNFIQHQQHQQAMMAAAYAASSLYHPSMIAGGGGMLSTAGSGASQAASSMLQQQAASARADPRLLTQVALLSQQQQQQWSAQFAGFSPPPAQPMITPSPAAHHRFNTTPSVARP